MRLAFEDVSYSYEGGEAKKRRGRRKKDAARQADWGNAPDAVWALRDVTFTVEPGSSSASRGAPAAENPRSSSI